MFQMRVKTEFRKTRVVKAVRDESVKSLGHAAALVRMTARRSIRRRKGPSRPGKPPHTKRGLLKRAIAYAVTPDKQEAVIGPSFNVAGQFGAAHEHGGRFGRESFPLRPFMGPAMEKIRHRLPKQWQGIIAK